MSHIKFASSALHDLKRLREFLRQKNQIAAKRATMAITKAIKRLALHPQMGKPIPDMEPAYRELLIDFGDSGYVAFYRLEKDAVILLTLRHQKESGY